MENASSLVEPVSHDNNNNSPQQALPQPVTSSTTTTATTAARIVSFGEGDDNNDNQKDDDDDKVEDMTEFMKKQRAADRKKRQQEETIELSSEEEDDDEDDDESVQEGSDGWEGMSSDDEDEDDGGNGNDDDDEDDDSDYKEGRKPAARKKNRNEDGDEEDEGYFSELSRGAKEDLLRVFCQMRQNSNSRKRQSSSSSRKTTTTKKPKQKKAPKKNKPPPPSPLQVHMQEKDIPCAPGKPTEVDETTKSNTTGLEETSTLVDGAGHTKANQAVKDRIMKLLNTGFHDQSNENEAKNAMKLANRLMQRHNLSQALLLKEREKKNKHGGNDDQVLKGGMVKVRIVNRKTQKPSQYARWISNLTWPVNQNFGVKSFSQKPCTVTFYGIYTNCQLAAYSFKLAVERIAQMTAQHQPDQVTPVFSWQKPISTRSSRLSYSLGIVNGLMEEVDRNLEMERQRQQRKLERARAAVSKGEAYEESDKEEEEEELGGVYNVDNADNDKEGPGFVSATTAAPAAAVGSSLASPGTGEDTAAENVKTPHDAEEDRKPKAKEMRGSDLDSRVQELETALTLVDHREKVAEDVLEENEIKLSSSRKRRPIQMNRRSFAQGKKDSKEIDLDQRAIRDETRVKMEEED